MRTTWTKLAMMAAGICLMAAGARARQTTPPPGAAQQPTKSEMRKAMEWKRFENVCAGNAKVIVYLRDELAKVRYADKQYFMKQTISADGNRYSDGKVLWWGKGTGGFLQEDTPDGNGAMIVKDCKLVEQSSTKPSGPGVVTGTVTYRERMALPPTAELLVQLVDVSVADMPAAVIAEEKITAGGRQVPIPFELKFDPAKIDGKHTYSMSAKVTVDGDLRMISDTSYPVVTEGNPLHVEMVLQMVEVKK